MTHTMKLYEASFEKMRLGRKASELRLNDEKRQKVNVGDIIEFTNTDNNEEKLLAKVTYLRTYPSFKALYDGVRDDYLDYQEEQFIDGMYQYYTPEEEQKYGALEIGIQLVEGLL